MKKIISILFFVTVALCGQGQNENTKWYFGSYAALDFMTNPPTILNNSAMNTWAGCSSIADTAGNLLFYTNGVNVWNKQHAIMANGTGLLGDNLSTQSSLIIKQPNSVNLYYIFTMATAFGTVNPITTDGLRFSIVDMNLAAGTGSVTVKNMPLYTSPCTQKLHATKHANGTDYWVVIHELNSNNFRTYLLSSIGVNTTAVISSVGNLYINTTSNFQGYLKISPIGKNLGMAINNNAIELYNFNKSTGMVSNPLILTTEANYCYGCEFSSDGTKFYAEYKQSIIQWDLSAGSNSAIISSSVALSTQGQLHGAMQLAPNGKIYLTTGYNTQSLSVINKPNKAGTACYFVYNSQPCAAVINPTLNSGSILGLPNMIPPKCSLIITGLSYDTLACSSTTLAAASVTYSGNIGNINCLWSNGAVTYSTATIPQVNNLSIGTWSINISDNYGCTTDSTFSILLQTPIISVSKSDICANEPVTLTASGANTYTWSTSQIGASITITPAVSAIYAVFGTDEYGCESNSQILISVSPCTGIKESEISNSEFLIYPNPTNEMLNVELEILSGKTEIQIFDVLGNIVVHHSTFTSHNSINVSNIPKGIYFVKIGKRTGKFVKE